VPEFAVEILSEPGTLTYPENTNAYVKSEPMAHSPRITSSSHIKTKDEETVMSEIADLLQQKAGLSPDKAQEVEQLVIEHVTSRVPPEFQGMLGSVLGTGSGDAGGQSGEPESGGLSGLLNAASGLFGGNKS
jgi:hypothetical protein